MTGTKPTWQRARRPEQISQRISRILDATGELFGEMPYDHVTMQLIAKRANFTRSNLYRYFRSREEIFLALLRFDMEIWMNEILSVFSQTISVPIESFVTSWTDILFRRKRLLRLLPLISLSLEKNVSENVYRDFKTSLNDMTCEVIPVIGNTLSECDQDQIGAFLLFNLALVAGAWPMSQYSFMQRSVLNDPELAWMKVDFKDFFRKSIAAYLRGTLQR